MVKSVPPAIFDRGTDRACRVVRVKSALINDAAETLGVRIVGVVLAMHSPRGKFFISGLHPIGETV
jgi:hypothetical protein